MSRTVIQTENAPAAIGTYCQAVRVGDTVYISGQIPLDPKTMDLVPGDVEAQTRQVFANLAAVVEAAGGSLAEMVKLNVYLTDLGNFPVVNKVMGELFQKPYPARAAGGISAVPRGSSVEVEGVLFLGD
jgi:reactive intermediate/imine deaminase